MRLHHKVILLSTLFTVNGLIGCNDDDTTRDTCMLTNEMCQPANKVLDKDKCECISPICKLSQAECQESNKELDIDNCQCVCSLTQEDCTHQGRVLDKEACNCKCELTESQCQINGRSLNKTNCQCICAVTQSECEKQNKILDESSCKCNCAITQDECKKQGQFLDDKTCQCVDACPLSQETCDADGKSFDQENCKCTCLLTQNDCTPKQTLDEENCQCIDNCQLSQEMCKAEGKSFDKDNCECIAACTLTQNDCSNNLILDTEKCKCTCPLSQKACNDQNITYFDDIDCECSNFCPRNEAICKEQGKFFDKNKCECTDTCPITMNTCKKETLKYFDDKNCKCTDTCPISPNDCREKGEYLNVEQCSCENYCDLTLESCKEKGNSPDLNLCQCYCALTEEACEPGTRFSQSDCECNMIACPDNSDYCKSLGKKFNGNTCECYCEITMEECYQKGKTLDEDKCECVERNCTITEEDCVHHYDDVHCACYLFSEDTCSTMGGKYENGICHAAMIDKKKYLKFGSYEGEDLTWILLKEDENKKLYISEKAIDIQPFNTESEFTTWENSTIRSWLNGYEASKNDAGKNYAAKDNFIQKAFTDDQRTFRLVEGELPSDPSINDTVFLLSLEEVQEYFPKEIDRQAEASSYAMQKGAIVVGTSGKSYSNNDCKEDHCYANWWLRTTINSSSEIYEIDYLGSPNIKTFTTQNIAVRPAIWVRN